ncbi:MAG: methyltransferase domain-containing protein [Candidatus Thiodiazotropha endolucinida]
MCDLGCGPGLYTKRFFAQGAEVTGIDFSEYNPGIRQIRVTW